MDTPTKPAKPATKPTRRRRRKGKSGDKFTAATRAYGAALRNVKRAQQQAERAWRRLVKIGNPT